MKSHRALSGTQKTFVEEQRLLGVRERAGAPLFETVRNVFQKNEASATCLYSAASMLPRNLSAALSAAAHRVASKDNVGDGARLFLVFVLIKRPPGTGSRVVVVGKVSIPIVRSRGSCPPDRRRRRPLRRRGQYTYTSFVTYYQLLDKIFMPNMQARDRVPNSAANSLPTSQTSAAGQLGQIVAKPLITSMFSTLRGCFSAAERRFFPENREM
jgi:hypothetical protein